MLLISYSGIVGCSVVVSSRVVNICLCHACAIRVQQERKKCEMRQEQTEGLDGYTIAA
jgi:hypothetical protein